MCQPVSLSDPPQTDFESRLMTSNPGHDQRNSGKSRQVQRLFKNQRPDQGYQHNPHARPDGIDYTHRNGFDGQRETVKRNPVADQTHETGQALFKTMRCRQAGRRQHFSQNGHRQKKIWLTGHV